MALFGFDPLTASTLMVLAAASHYGDECPKRPRTKINVIPVTEEVKYDYSKSLKELQGQASGTVDPYGFHGTTVTQAYMSGTIAPQASISFDYNEIKGRRGICLWYKSIDVDIKIDPTIVIAQELYKDSCMRKALIGHELKHVKVDREVVNDYANLIGKKLLKELKARGFAVGPIPFEEAERVTGKMRHVVKQILELEYQKMHIDRQERQREVDNLEEYQSIDKKCPRFQEKKRELYSTLGE
ncbi:MAG: hypothetical protein OEY94_05110 [Alphaproteobacteria bacterium]|nr:hypothetical protein [Alphaproteobacteria bacterium]